MQYFTACPGPDITSVQATPFRERTMLALMNDLTDIPVRLNGESHEWEGYHQVHG